MRKTIVIISVEEITETQKEYDTYSDGDGMTSIGGSSYVSSSKKVRTGSMLHIKECAVSMDRQISQVEGDWAKARELGDQLPYGFEINYPQHADGYAEHKPLHDNSVTVRTEKIIPEGNYICLIHSGIRGDYMTEVSVSYSIIMEMDRGLVDNLKLSDNPDYSVDEPTINYLKEMYVVAFPEGIDYRYMPQRQDVDTEEPAQEEVNTLEDNPIWGALQGLKF
jgi:hypothetical protein